MSTDGSTKRKSPEQGGRSIGESTGEKHQYFCDFCRKDISDMVRIRCAECKDFDLCLECFSVGVEVFPHKNDHKYRVMYHVTTPIFDEGWGADEELLLLEAIEQCGFGNWVDIADHIGTKTKEECERHYEDIYLSNQSSDPPVPSLTRPLVPKAAKPPDPVVGAQENYTGSKANHRPGSCKGLLGYLPKRGDFDQEWENDSEKKWLHELVFKPDDSNTERDLKLQIIRAYNLTLDGRAERKQMIFDRQFLTRERKRGKDEKDVTNQLQMFGRYLPHDEWEKFANGIQVEAALRKEIAKLQMYIKNGLRSELEIEAFDHDRKRRAVSSATFGISNKRRHSKVSDESDMLSKEEIHFIKEAGIAGSTYLKLKHYLIITDVQNADTPQERPKKKQKTPVKIELPASLQRIEKQKIDQLKEFLKTHGIIDGGK
ncbi:hypothetical protein AAMO2058_000320300 [Amorphochlora amoebiformis]